jgi:hypothetical protein
MTAFRKDQVKTENVTPRKIPVTTVKERVPVTTSKKKIPVTKVPYYIKDPRIVTVRYSTLKEPQVIYSWTRTTPPAPSVSTIAPTYRNFIKGVKTTWAKEKIMGVDLLPTTLIPPRPHVLEKKSKSRNYIRRGKYLARTSSKALHST